jgi:hypothetical protein
MKKISRIDFRGTPEEMQGFKASCDACGVKASAVIRDLCRAATFYMKENCQDGRWRPPVLITERESARLDTRLVSGEVVQIHNGNGHQKAQNARKRRG